MSGQDAQKKSATSLSSCHRPDKPTIDQIESDLASIEINENDALFNGPKAAEAIGKKKQIITSRQHLNDDNDEDATFYERLEKYILFKLNLETSSSTSSENNKNTNISSLSLDYLNKDLDTLDKHIGSLKNFIEISKKFLETNKK